MDQVQLIVSCVIGGVIVTLLCLFVYLRYKRSVLHKPNTPQDNVVIRKLPNEDRVDESQGGEYQVDESQGGEYQVDESQGGASQGGEDPGDEEQGDASQEDEERGDASQGDEEQVVEGLVDECRVEKPKHTANNASRGSKIRIEDRNKKTGPSKRLSSSEPIAGQECPSSGQECPSSGQANSVPRIGQKGTGPSKSDNSLKKRATALVSTANQVVGTYKKGTQLVSALGGVRGVVTSLVHQGVKSKPKNSDLSTEQTNTGPSTEQTNTGQSTEQTNTGQSTEQTNTDQSTEQTNTGQSTEQTNTGQSTGQTNTGASIDQTNKDNPSVDINPNTDFIEVQDAADNADCDLENVNYQTQWGEIENMTALHGNSINSGYIGWIPEAVHEPAPTLFNNGANNLLGRFIQFVTPVAGLLHGRAAENIQPLTIGP